jgi:uncharacterized membrane protein
MSWHQLEACHSCFGLPSGIFVNLLVEKQSLANLKKKFKKIQIFLLIYQKIGGKIQGMGQTGCIFLPKKNG